MEANPPTRSAPGKLVLILGAVFVVLAYAHPAFADGGRLRFRQPAGPFVVSLFTTPNPLRVGRADFSVAVERSGAQDAGADLIPDAQVDLTLTPVSARGKPLILHASHSAATSKWLQAANFSLPARGVWRVTVVVRRGNQVGQCSGEVQVNSAGAAGAAGPEGLTWDVMPVPLLALLFVLHQYRKRKYNRARLPRHPPETRSPMFT